MLNPDLLDLDLPVGIFVFLTARIFAFFLQLTESLQLLFNFIMKHTQQLMRNERNNLPNSYTLCILLTVRSNPSVSVAIPEIQN